MLLGLRKLPHCEKGNREMKGPCAVSLPVAMLSLLLGMLGCALPPTHPVATYEFELDTRKSALAPPPQGSTVLPAKGETTATANWIATANTVSYESPKETQPTEPELLPGTTEPSEDFQLPTGRHRRLVAALPQTNGPREKDGFETPEAPRNHTAPISLHMDDLEVRKALELL